MKEEANLKARFEGCLLGLAIGDAVGATYEGLFADLIMSYGGGDKIVRHESGEKLMYTDDTQMMIGVAETLVEHGKIDEPTLCQRFGANYQKGRGYGQGVRSLIEAMANNEYLEELAYSVFPDGSYGNGAAMRIAPVGLIFGDDNQRLEKEVVAASRVTHAHELGIDGARVIAKAVGVALASHKFERSIFFNALIECVKTEEFKWQLETARDLPEFSSVSFGNELAAHKSVVTSLICFADSPNDYSAVISRAIGAGGDVDTIAAMAGAIAGAFLGVEAVPKKLLQCLENDHKGLDYIRELAHQLFAIAST